MGRWLVTQGNNQFSVEGLGELKDLAKSGKLGAGDMIQPPGATDWIYASEVPELQGLLPDDADDDDDFEYRRGGGMGKIIGAVAAVVLVLITIGGGIAMFVLWQQLPTGDEQLLGEDGLSYTEMLVTEEGGAPLLSEPNGASKSNSKVKKDSVLNLLSKRGEFYKAETKGGKQGWISIHHVIPMYQLGGADVREKYDPLYNPDLYVDVANARWSQLPDQEKDKITIFQFQMRNKSNYNMTDLIVQATIKDSKGQMIEKVEIPIEGIIPATGRTMVGTLKADPKAKGGKKGKKGKGKGKSPLADGRRLLTKHTIDVMAEADGDIYLRFSDGAEVAMGTDDFTKAEIDIVELRAMPDDEARKVQQELAAKGEKVDLLGSRKN